MVNSCLWVWVLGCFDRDRREVFFAVFFDVLSWQDHWVLIIERFLLGHPIVLSWLLVPCIIILVVDLLNDELYNNPTTVLVLHVPRRSWSQSIDLAIVVSLIALKSLDETVEEA
ncbi:hypothetical protein HG531_000618 [Fusarium graminearum]|nr:hypothetical protein HG531_000618 [Fusarium graminearum]